MKSFSARSSDGFLRRTRSIVQTPVYTRVFQIQQCYKRVQVGSYLCNAGESCRGMIMVLSGELVVVASKREPILGERTTQARPGVHLALLQADEVFGARELVEHSTRWLRSLQAHPRRHDGSIDSRIPRWSFEQWLRKVSGLFGTISRVFWRASTC